MVNTHSTNKAIETHCLRPNQERYLLAEKASPYSYFIGIWVVLPGRLDSRRLRNAAIQALSRHSAFRTTFPRTDEGTYRAEVLRRADLIFETHEVSDLEEATVEAAAAPLMVKLEKFERLCDLHRLLLLDAPDGRQALVLAQHHAVSDGRSLDLLLSEISALYSGENNLPPPTSYYTYAPSDKTKDDDKAFWEETLSNVDSVPQMHRALRSFSVPRPVRAGRTLDKETSALLRHPPNGVTAFSMLAAGFAAQIARQTGQREVVFSIQSAGRHGLGDARVLGPLSNAVPICIKVNFAETAVALASRLRMRIRECLRHEGLGYHRILQTAAVRPDFALNLYPDPEPLAFEKLIPGARRFLTSESDYAVNLRWHRKTEGQIAVDIYHDSAVIETRSAEAFLARAVAITKSIVSYPDRPIAQSLIASRVASAPELGTKPEEKPRRLADIFADCVNKYGTRTAIRFNGQSISYSELAENVENLAAHLHAAGLEEGMKIAFLADRTPAFVETILACSRLGLPFCALDSSYPSERIRQQAELLAPQAVLFLEDGMTTIAEALLAGGLRVLQLNRNESLPAAPFPKPPTQDAIAYYLFTSGTTGVPSLVGTRHAALPAFLRWEAATFDVVPGETTSLLSGLAHDPVLRDVFLPLTTGGTLAIPSANTMRDPRTLAQWLKDERPNIIHTTPPLGRFLWQPGEVGPCFPGARLVLWGGDMLPGELIEAATKANADLVQVNAYGATETPQVMLWHQCSAEDEKLRAVPVGRPRGEIGVWISTLDGEQGDVNDLGEIVIKMPDHVVRAKGGAGRLSAIGSIYHTGDLGYQRPDGAIQVIGRADDQISIRGYRVELSEVSSILSGVEGVVSSVVLEDQDSSGASILTGHVVAASGCKIDTLTLRRRLATLVPSYMVPARLMIHDALPLLPNGKIDRAALRALQNAVETDQVTQAAKPTATMTPSEAAVADIFSATLGRLIIDIDMSFVDLGADSLNAIQAMLRLERIIPDLPEEWPNMTIAELGGRVRNNEEDVSVSQVGGLRRMATTTRAELPVVFRALAILSVVALHYGVGSIGGGATIILFVLAGYSMARFQLPQVLSEATARPILIPVMRVIAVTVPVVFMILVMKAVQGEPFQPAGILFLTNFLDFSDPANSAGGTIWLWFIAVYVQIMLFIAAIVTLPWVRNMLAMHPGPFMVVTFLLTATLKYAVLGLADISLLTDGVPPLTPWNYLPTTHLATILLGMLVFLGRAGHVDRLFCSTLIVSYAFSVGMVFENNRPEVFAAVTLAVLWIGSIRVPRGVYALSLAVSQSSLYLYLLHEPLRSVMHLVGVALPPLLGMGFAVIFAICFTHFWDQLMTIFSRRRTDHISTAGI